MSLYNIINEFFDEGMASVEFSIKCITQCNDENGKYIATIFYNIGNEIDTTFSIESNEIISLNEIYKNWCERCLKDLKENNNMDWWEFDLNGKISDERYQEIEKIIKEKYKNIYEDYEDYE